jgi:hypothetical protein
MHCFSFNISNKLTSLWSSITYFNCTNIVWSFSDSFSFWFSNISLVSWPYL